MIDWWKQSIVGSPGRKRTYALLGLAVVVAVAAGYVAGALRERGRHSATAEVLVGTVMESNESSHWIVFYPDGVVRPQNDGNSLYYVIADSWVDGSGNFHEGAYPACLVAHSPDEVAAYWDGASPRVELTTIDWDTGGGQPMHIAVQVHCL
jgi:hypothetical protein